MKRLLPLLALLAPACRAFETEDLALELPAAEAWQAGEHGGVVSTDPWWLGFGDAGLDAVIAEALEHNRDLRAAAHRVGAAAAQAAIAGADRLPGLSAGLSGARNKQIFVGLPIPGGGDVLESLSTSYNASLNIAWELDLWGRIAALENAAEADFVATAADWNGTRQSIAARTARAWTAWQEARLQEDLARRTVESFARNDSIVRDRFESGLTDALDLRLATNNVASARALRELRREQVARTVRTLEILLGRYPDGTLAGDATLPLVGATPPAGLPSELLLRRPDLLAAEARVLAADERLFAARKDLLPRLSLTASGGRTSNDLSDLTDADFDIWAIAGNLTAPLFQGGRLSAAIDLSEARVREAIELYASRSLIAFGEVEAALAAEAFLAEQERHVIEASEAATAASEIADERYVAGLDDLITVLEAQRRALDSQTNLIDIRRRRLDTRIDLYLALGGGFGESENPTSDEEPSR